MSAANSFPAQHQHVFLGSEHDRHERRTWLVVGLTSVMMVAEIVAGTVFGSMALMADGWHMSTHAAALGIAAFAYRFARQHAHDRRFSFGTGKLGDLAAFASALLLMFIALAVAGESALRLYTPIAIDFTQATAIAVLGLAVNLASAWLLRGEHGHHHGHSHSGTGHHGHAHDHDQDHDDHDHGDHHHGHHSHGGHGADTNLRAAYMHVIADAFTSVLAIAALLGGRYYGWVWLDPVMGIVGAGVIAHWSIGLLRSSGPCCSTPCRTRRWRSGSASGLPLRGQRSRSPSLAGRARPSQRHRLDRHWRAQAARDLQGPARRPPDAVPCHHRGECASSRGLNDVRQRRTLQAARERI